MAAFRKELRRLSENSDEAAEKAAVRLRAVDEKIEVLSRNMMISEGSSALHRLLADLEQERARLELIKPSERPKAEILPHPILLERFKEKIRNLRLALSDDAVRPQAAELIGQLIKSVTIYPGETPELKSPPT